VQFRVEAFNISNTPNFFMPNTNSTTNVQFGTSAFGTISQTDPNYVPPAVPVRVQSAVLIVLVSGQRRRCSRRRCLLLRHIECSDTCPSMPGGDDGQVTGVDECIQPSRECLISASSARRGRSVGSIPSLKCAIYSSTSFLPSGAIEPSRRS
jgi:hypothetical protein